MQWSDLSFRPDTRLLRQFALLWLLVFGALAIWHGLINARPTLGLFLAGLAIAIGPVGVVRPRWIQPIYVGWIILAFPIGWTFSRVILALVYYGVFTPLGLTLRLFGHDPLMLRNRKQDPDASYWLPISPVNDPRRYFDQF